MFPQTAKRLLRRSGRIPLLLLRLGHHSQRRRRAGLYLPGVLWEIDLFIADDHTPRDQNHGLTLAQARQNYAGCGAVLPRLAAHSRPPLPTELAIFLQQK